jgi:hypothetical protein
LQNEPEAKVKLTIAQQPLIEGDPAQLVPDEENQADIQV